MRELITPQIINVVDENRMTALHLAAKNGNSSYKLIHNIKIQSQSSNVKHCKAKKETEKRPISCEYLNLLQFGFCFEMTVSIIEILLVLVQNCCFYLRLFSIRK